MASAYLHLTDLNGNDLTLRKDQVLYVFKSDGEEPGTGPTTVVLDPSQDDGTDLQVEESVSDVTTQLEDV